jgi:lipid-A-disaccharide synthase-like uncharacterized protein
MAPDTWWVVACGWAGQACFFSRFFVQWWVSERAKRSVAPPLFWWLSALGAVLLSIYSVPRGEAVLLPGYLITLCIYLRNLWIARRGPTEKQLHPAIALGLAALACLGLWWSGAFQPRAGMHEAPVWLTIGIVGQTLWTARFLVQWWSTERTGASHFPRLFWWLSLSGNALLLAYAIHLRDAVYIAGFIPGPIVQIRNLMLHRDDGTDAVEVEAPGVANPPLSPPRGDV